MEQFDKLVVVLDAGSIFSFVINVVTGPSFHLYSVSIYFINSVQLQRKNLLLFHGLWRQNGINKQGKLLFSVCM